MTVKLCMSACLVGQCCRYDAKTYPSIVDKRLHYMLNGGEVAVLCPECSVGLDTPREAAEIEPGKTADDVLNGNGRVLTQSGKDVTAFFIKGAENFVALARKHGVKVAVLKSKSPSCGMNTVYDGTHSGKLISGQGIAAAALAKEGLALYDEHHLKEALDALKE